MALTFTTGMTQIDPADSTTNWSAYKITAGGATPTATLDNTLYKEGTGALYIAPTASKDQGMVFDYYTANGNTTLNLSTSGNEVIGIWLLLLTPAIVTTEATGGVYIILEGDNGIPSSTSIWAKWYVSGSDVDKGGWQYFQVDTRKTPSATNGGWTSANLSAVYRIGAGINASATTFHGVGSFYIDASWYGRPIYTLTGDGTTTADWSSFLSDSTTNANGLVQDLGGAYQLACGVQVGTSGQTATTTFTDTSGKQLIMRRSTYHNGTSVVDALNYADYYVFRGNGAASFKTSITLGTVVGTGSNQQGLLGGAIRSSDHTNLTWSADFQTNAANMSAQLFYGFTFDGAEGGVLLDNDSGGTLTELITCAFDNCGEVDPGTTGNGAVLLNCSLIDPLGGTTANRGLKWHTTNNVTQLSCITSGSPATQHMLELPDSGGYTTTFNAIKFFGDYSSSTLWHGEISTAGETVTINATNGSNPTATEFEDTGGGSTVTVQNAVSVSLHVQDSLGTAISGARVGILISDNVVQEYASTNQDTVISLYSGSTTRAGQTWTADGSIINKLRFDLKKTGTPTGTVTASLYATSAGAPTGAALTSGTIDVGELTTTFADVLIPLQVPYTTTAATVYAVVVEFSGGDASNTLDVGADNSAPTDAGTGYTYNGTWSSQTYDFCYGIISDELLSTSTDASGNATFSYNYQTDTAIDVRVRKSSTGTTRYLPLDASGTILSTGFSATYTLTRDSVAAP